MQLITTWGDYQSYEDYRNAEIAQRENRDLFDATNNVQEAARFLVNYSD